MKVKRRIVFLYYIYIDGRHIISSYNAKGYNSLTPDEENLFCSTPIIENISTKCNDCWYGLNRFFLQFSKSYEYREHIDFIVRTNIPIKNIGDAKYINDMMDNGRLSIENADPNDKIYKKLLDVFGEESVNHVLAQETTKQNKKVFDLFNDDIEDFYNAYK